MVIFVYYGCLSSAKLDRWQVQSNGLHVDQCLVEQTAYRTEIKRPRDNGYKSVFTNPWLLRQKNRSSIKGLCKNLQKERTRSLFAVPFFLGHLTVTPWTPRNDCVYTRQPQLWHGTSSVLTSLPTELAKIAMCVKTLAARRHNNFFRV